MLTQGSQTVHNSPRTPHLQQDLLTLFGLQPLAATVARTDPKTGEKINKMRKSYEGQVKRLGLAGRNRAVKHNNEKSMGLLQITRLPAEEWHIQRVHGRDIRDGLPEATLQKLGSAMQMESGPAKKSDEHDWDDLLGIEKVKPLPNIEDRSKKHMRPENGSKVNGQTNGVRTAPSKGPVTEANRPKRAGKKRRYDDSSFEGYDEGYLDDEGDVLGDLGGNSSEDGSRKGGAAKKRKKVTTFFSVLSLRRVADMLSRRITFRQTRLLWATAEAVMESACSESAVALVPMDDEHVHDPTNVK